MSASIAAPSLPSGADLRALHDRLAATRSFYYAQLRAPRGSTFLLVAHNDIDALNADLAIVHGLNTERDPYHRSSAVAAWGDPVLRTTILMSPRDIIPTLDLALRVVAAALDREAHDRALAALAANPHAWPAPELPPAAGTDPAAPSANRAS